MFTDVIGSGLIRVSSSYDYEEDFETGLPFALTNPEREMSYTRAAAHEGARGLQILHPEGQTVNYGKHTFDPVLSITEGQWIRFQAWLRWPTYDGLHRPIKIDTGVSSEDGQIVAQRSRYLAIRTCEDDGIESESPVIATAIDRDIWYLVDWGWKRGAGNGESRLNIAGIGRTGELNLTIGETRFFELAAMWFGNPGEYTSAHTVQIDELRVWRSDTF